MTHTPADYRDQLRRLEPPGKLLASKQPDLRLSEFHHAGGDELARVDGRAEDVLRESIPDTVAELLDDWERVFGLPDACVGAESTTALRRAALVTKVTSRGAGAPPDLMAAAGTLGFFVFAIEEYDPMRAGDSVPDGGSRAGDALTQDTAGWAHTFTVHAPIDTLTEFRASEGRCVDPLREFGNAPLECVIERIKPSHARALFNYGGCMTPPVDEWFAVQGDVPALVAGQPMPPRSPAEGPYELENFPNFAGNWGQECGDYPAEGQVVWAQMLVKVPLGPQFPATDDFSVTILHSFPATFLAAATFTWQADGTLSMTGGTLPGAYAEEVEDGWWRCVLPWLVGSTEEGERRWINLTMPATPPGATIRSLWVGHSGFSHFQPQ